MFQFDAIEHDRESLRCRCVIPTDLPCFNGHFPDLPIMPAAAQLDMLSALLQRHGDWGGDISGGSRLKFSGRIQPGDQLSIELQRLAPGKLRFSVATATGTAASGTLQLTGCNHD